MDQAIRELLSVAGPHQVIREILQDERRTVGRVSEGNHAAKHPLPEDEGEDFKA